MRKGKEIEEKCKFWIRVELDTYHTKTEVERASSHQKLVYLFDLLFDDLDLAYELTERLKRYSLSKRSTYLSLEKYLKRSSPKNLRTALEHVEFLK